jgi:hypothetical protein
MANSRFMRGEDKEDKGGGMKCLVCEDTGWVCENHPDQPWEGPHACQCGGAGMADSEYDQLWSRRAEQLLRVSHKIIDACASDTGIHYRSAANRRRQRCGFHNAVAKNNDG